MEKLEGERKEAIKRYLSCEPVEAIFREIGRSKRWFYKWIGRYDPKDPYWYKSRSRAPHNTPHKTPPGIEDVVLKIREKLKKEDTFYGPLAIQWTMEDLGYNEIPHENTIKKILKRNGKIEPHKSKNEYKPKNIPYPKIEVDMKPNIVHEADFLGPRYLEGGYCFYFLNIMDVGTHRVALNITEDYRGTTSVKRFVSSWQRLGIPKYLKLDNQSCFRGSNRYPRGFGFVIRLCLNLNIEPVFIPLSEPWRNGYIEKFQDTFQKMFLRKYHFRNPEELMSRAVAFERRHNEKYRYSYLKGKAPVQAFNDRKCSIEKLPKDFRMPNLKERPNEGFIHVIRFIRSDRILQIFGEKFTAPKEAVYQYVKATIDLKEEKIFLHLYGKVIEEIDYSYSIS